MTGGTQPGPNDPAIVEYEMALLSCSLKSCARKRETILVAQHQQGQPMAVACAVDASAGFLGVILSEGFALENNGIHKTAVRDARRITARRRSASSLGLNGMGT